MKFPQRPLVQMLLLLVAAAAAASRRTSDAFLGCLTPATSLSQQLDLERELDAAAADSRPTAAMPYKVVSSPLSLRVPLADGRHFDPACFSRMQALEREGPQAEKLGQPAPRTHPHLLSKDEVVVGLKREEFTQRRKNLMEKLEDGAMAVVVASPNRIFSNDVNFKFRQNSDFLYLSGCLESDAVLVLEKGKDGKGTFSMFVNPSTLSDTGAGNGLEGTKELFSPDVVHPISEIPTILKEKSGKASQVLISGGTESEQARLVREALGNKARDELDGMLAELRSVKSESEVKLMKKAGLITAAAFIEAMKHTQPRISEADLETLTEYEIKGRGAAHLAYPTIVASGANSLNMHYEANNDILKDGKMLYMDAGAEFGGYAADITRSWPVNGKFSKEQREIYEIVLEAQKACIKAAQPGSSLTSAHATSSAVINAGLKKLGLLEGGRSVSEFFTHNVGHPLGLDVHDPNSHQPLRDGEVITCEPAIYVPTNVAMPQYGGIGVRIEDDVLVRKSGGAEVLSSGLPKEIEEIEHLMAGAGDKRAEGSSLEMLFQPVVPSADKILQAAGPLPMDVHTLERQRHAEEDLQDQWIDSLL